MCILLQKYGQYMYWCKTFCVPQFFYHNPNSTVRQEKCGGITPPQPIFLLLAERSAIGTLIGSGIGLVGAHQDSIQGAVVRITAVIGALMDGTFNTLVCMAAHR